MATSGSSNYSITRNTIFQIALRRINVLARGQDMSAEMQSTANDNLNLMIKEWQADKLHLWTIQEATLFLAASQASYTLSPTGDHCTSSYVETDVRVAGVATDVTIEVDSTTGMTAADNIGILLDAGTLHWTTIASITDSDTLVIDTALPSAIAVDNTVVTYTTKINRPMQLLTARRYISSTNEYDIPVVSRKEYDELTDKTSSGSVVQVYYDAQLTSKLHVWPPSDTEKDRIKLTVQRPLEDFDNPTDNPDFPIEWGNAIIWNLALQLCGEYMVSDSIMRRVAAFAAESKTRATNFDSENTSVFFQPDESMG